MRFPCRPTILLALAVAAVGAQQPSRSPVIPAYARGAEAFAKKDYQAAASHFRQALEGSPTDPDLMAESARAHLLAGDRARALDLLRRAVALEGGLDVLDDPVVAPLLDEGDGSLRRAAEALRKPISSSQEAYRLAQRDLIPEGIAYDPVGRAFYVGSIYRRKIVRVDAATGRATSFKNEKDDGLMAVLGMKVDAKRRLWVATEGTRNMMEGTEADVGRSALMAYDLESGKLLAKHVVQPDPERHLFNDIALTPAGDVYVTDSEAGAIYRLGAGASRLERWIAPRTFEYPNGIVLAGDGKRLFVAHVAGIDVVDIATRRAAPLPHPPGITLVGVDGLSRDHHTLVAVQNGITPRRVVEFTLNDAEDRVVSSRTLERNHPLFASIPTTGDIADGWYYYIGNAQLRAFTPDFRILPMDKLQEPVILKVKLR